MSELDDLEVDVAGIPMPATWAFWPDQITTVTLTEDDGTCHYVRFEAFLLYSGTNRVHCTVPRCRWSHPVFDEQEMIAHARSHIEGVNHDGE